MVVTVRAGHAWAWPEADVRCARGPVAVGADLSPATLLSAYREGMFVFPSRSERRLEYLDENYGADLRAGRIAVLGDSRPGFALPWFDPDPRPVIRPGDVHLGRTFRRTLLRSGWTTTVNLAVERVLAQCGPDRGNESWLTADLVVSFSELAAQGHAYSFEVWESDELVGAIFGIRIGGVLSGETGFSKRSGTAKAAMIDAVTRVADGGGLLLDTQVPSEHTKALGAVQIPRAEFRACLAARPDSPVTIPTERRTVADLVARYYPPPMGRVDEQ
jgi:leucyl/phenylalanyl-tRNA--protein transferase